MREGISIACIMHRGRKVFIAHRQNTGDMGGRWEFPGGKVEAGETDKEAAKREMQEEFGVDIYVGQLITENHFFHRGKERVLRAYDAAFPSGIDTKTLALTEHSECKWVDIDEITTLSFVDSDMAIYPCVKQFVEASYD